MPWSARQPTKPELLFSTDGVKQMAGAVLTACPAALTVPLERSQAPGWPGRFWVSSTKLLPELPVLCVDPEVLSSEVTGMTVWLGGGGAGGSTAVWRSGRRRRW